MLDPRVYRAAFAPLLLALVVTAFSLVDRPRPIQTTLAPDAFDGGRAFATLRELSARFGDRRPGSAGDARLAGFVERSLRSSFCGSGPGCTAVRVRSFEAQTVDGERRIRTVVANRLGRPGPGIVLVADRDAAGRGAEAQLSGTAALLELGRVLGGRQTQRTLTLVSTSGGSGGAAGARELAGNLPAGDRPPDAVLVLGDLASQRAHKPWVLPWSTSSDLAPVQLARTAEAAVRTETGEDPGAPRATTQFARMAFPFALGDEGPLNAAGVRAVRLQASGERGPGASAAVSPDRLRAFGRAALRTIDALDNGPDVSGAPAPRLVVRGMVMPGWAVRLVVGALLLPALLAAVDALARVRRRRAGVLLWLRWLAVLALPFALTAGLVLFLGAVGLLPAAPDGAVVAGRVPADGIALAVAALVFVLGCLLVRPLHRAAGVEAAPEGAGPAAALGLTSAVLAVAVWLANPFAAAVLVLPAHLWLVVGAPEVRLRRGASVALVLAALVPAALVLAVYAHAIGASPVQLPWALLLLVAGGQVGLLALAAICVVCGCAVAAVRLALRPAAEEPARAAAPSVRGPLGYAGPGSLGGTESALRVRR